MEDDILDFKRPSHGFLGGWADQGVLLLNSVGFVKYLIRETMEGVKYGWKPKLGRYDR